MNTEQTSENIFTYINNKLIEIENNIKCNITEQVNETTISIDGSIIDALK